MPDFEHCYRAVRSRDRRFDGWIYPAVRTTGIYCRPSCPAITPKTPRRENLRFYATAAAAQEAGFRACRRCQPDAVTGSPEWGSSGRRGGAGDAARRRWRRRPGRCRRPGGATRLHDAPPRPRSDRRTRRRTPRSGTSPPCPHRAPLAGDDDGPRDRRRLCRRVRQRPTVQRHDPRGLRGHSDRGPPPGAPQPRRHPDRPAVRPDHRDPRRTGRKGTEPW